MRPQFLIPLLLATPCGCHVSHCPARVLEPGSTDIDGDRGWVVLAADGTTYPIPAPPGESEPEPASPSR